MKQRWSVHKWKNTVPSHTHTHTHSQTEFGAVSVGVKGFNKEADQLTFFSWAPKLLQTVTAATKLKDACCLEEKL